MASESGVPPSPESSVVRHAASHYSTFRASLLTRYPTAPRPARCTDRDHSPHGPKGSNGAGPIPVTGRALLGLSRFAVSNRLQPVSLRYANHASLHQPCTRRTHPERDTQRRADTNARLTLGHLTWPIALSDRTGLPPREEKPHRVQPGSTRVYTRA